MSWRAHTFNKECARNYPPKAKLKSPLAPWFRCVWIKICPTKIGSPSKRFRVLSFNLDVDTLVWIGPEDPAAIYNDFMSISSLETILTGDVYFVCSDAAVKERYKKFMVKRKLYIGDTQFSVRGLVILRSFLAPGQLSRVEEYADLYKNRHGVFPIEGYVVDVLQNPGSAGDVSGKWIPSQLRSGTYYSCGARRLAFASEHVFANG